MKKLLYTIAKCFSEIPGRIKEIAMKSFLEIAKENGSININLGFLGWTLALICFAPVAFLASIVISVIVLVAFLWIMIVSSVELLGDVYFFVVNEIKRLNLFKNKK